MDEVLIEEWTKEFTEDVGRIDYVFIGTNFKMWDDYTYDDKTQIRDLKPEASPYEWTANGNKFKTLDELIVWLQLNCINDERRMLNEMRHKEENMFMNAWREASR